MDAHQNSAYGTVLTPPSPATSGTTLVLTASDGLRFLDPAVYGAYNVSVWPVGVQPLYTTGSTTLNAEIVRVTGKTGDTLTIVRAQESTTARTIVAGDQVSNTISKKVLTDVERKLGHIYSAELDFGFVLDFKTVFEYTLAGSHNVMTSGSNTVDTTTQGVATPFQATDVGKRITVRGAGASGAMLVGYIGAVNSATQCTVLATPGGSALNASTTVTATTSVAFAVQWGTDNTNAIVAMMAAVNNATWQSVKVTFGHSSLTNTNGTDFTNAAGFPIPALFSKTMILEGIGGTGNHDTGDYTKSGGTRLAWWGTSNDGGVAFQPFFGFAPTTGLTATTISALSLRDVWFDGRNGDQNQALKGVDFKSVTNYTMQDVGIIDCLIGWDNHVIAPGIAKQNVNSLGEAKDCTRGMVRGLRMRLLDAAAAPIAVSGGATNSGTFGSTAATPAHVRTTTNHANSSTVTITVTGTPVDGEMMVFPISAGMVSGGNSVTSVPTGWTAFASTPYTSTGTQLQTMYWKVASSEGTNPTYNFGLASAAAWAAGLVEWSGVTGGQPQTIAVSGLSGTTPATPVLGTSNNGCGIVGIMIGAASNNPTTWTQPASTTLDGTNTHSGVGQIGNVGIIHDTTNQVSAGNTTARTMTASATQSSTTGVTIAMAPQTTGGSSNSVTVGANTLPATGYLWIMSGQGYYILGKYTGGGSSPLAVTIDARDTIATPTWVVGSAIVQATPGNAPAMRFDGDAGANACLNLIESPIILHGSTSGPPAVMFLNSDSNKIINPVINGGDKTNDGVINRVRKPGIGFYGAATNSAATARNNDIYGGSAGAGGVVSTALTSASALLAGTAGPNHFWDYELGNGEAVPVVEVTAGGAGAVFYWTGNGGFNPDGGNQSIANQTAIVNARTILTGSVIAQPPQGCQAGTHIRWECIYTHTATAAVHGPIIVHFGTTGGTGDGTVASFTLPTGVASTAQQGKFVLDLIVRTVPSPPGAGATAAAFLTAQQGTASGFFGAPVSAGPLVGTMTAFDTSGTKFFSVSMLTAAAGASMTPESVTCQVIRSANP